MSWLQKGAQLCPLDESTSTHYSFCFFWTIHLIFLITPSSLSLCMSACPILPVFSTWLHVRFMKCQSAEVHLTLSHFCPSCFTHVATCNLRTSSHGFNAQGSISSTLCLVLIKKSTPFCTSNLGPQIYCAAQHTVRGMWNKIPAILSPPVQLSPSLFHTGISTLFESLSSIVATAVVLLTERNNDTQKGLRSNLNVFDTCETFSCLSALNLPKWDQS